MLKYNITKSGTIARLSKPPYVYISKSSFKLTNKLTNALSNSGGTPGNMYTFLTTTSGNLFFSPVFLFTPYSSLAEVGTC